MQFSQLCASAGLPQPQHDISISSIVHHTQHIVPGCLFVAIKGLRFDSHEYIDQAIKQGAVAIVHSYADPHQISVPSIKVDNSAQALGLLWAAWLQWPSRQLKVAGVTGTDGKTTTVNLLHHFLTQAGQAVGSISTINALIGSQPLDTGLHVTSPDAPQMQQLLHRMVQSHLQKAVVEVTSHAISQHRTAGLELDQAIITNITAEHLDYHGTIENYRDTKAQLFTHTNFSIINLDDPFASTVQQQADGQIQTYSLSLPAFASAQKIIQLDKGFQFQMTIDGHHQQMTMLLPGHYNISNVLAASIAAYNWGVSLQQMAQALPTFQQLQGRFEEVPTHQPYRVIIDFAHTPHSLGQVLQAARQQLAPSGKLWLIFGCPSERDNSKRPHMGYQAGLYADFTILTTEDPRHEQVANINQQIEPGLRKAGATQHQSSGHTYLAIEDRRQAIAHALTNAQANDIILITGKGHEQSLAIGDQEIPWNDRQVVEQLLKATN